MKHILYALVLCGALAAGAVNGLGAEKAIMSTKAGKAPKVTHFEGPVGLQLYSLRNEFSKDVPGTMTMANKFGFNLVELAGTYNEKPAHFRRMLGDHNMTAISGHFPYDRLKDDIDGVVREAKALHLKYVGCAWIPHDAGFDIKKCQEAIAVFNRAGEVLTSHGIKFFYHQHGYEFAPWGQGTLLDLMMEQTNPHYVCFEMDIFWVVFPGQDPVKLLEKYGRRWELMHLKDMRKGLQTGSLSGSTDVSNDVAIGAGQMNIPAILSAAKKAKIKYYFIEDESPSSKAQIPESLRYLHTVTW
jgi:sugar phosphate isomerase/epimerase